MATKGTALLTLSVRFASHQLPLYVKESETVDYVIQKAAAALNEDRQGMVILLKGKRLNERDIIGVSEVLSRHPCAILHFIVQVAIGRDPVTVLHIQKHSNVNARASESPLTQYLGPTHEKTGQPSPTE